MDYSKAVDLHIHSYYSDGDSAPEIQVKRAKDFGYMCCALTDHDGVDGLDRALAAGKENGIKVIPGIELSSEHFAEYSNFGPNKYFMHILGYGVNYKNSELKDALEDLMQRRFVRNEQIREAFCKRGIEITLEELQAYTPQGFVGKPSFARVLVAKGCCATLSDAFHDENLLGAPEIRAIRKDKVSADTAIRLIRSAGGIAFFAHPFQLSYVHGQERDPDEIYNAKLGFVVADLARRGMSGIEACYPTHSNHQAAFAVELAKKNNLLVSRGSDDHGKGVRKIKEMGPFYCELDPEYYSWTKEFL